MAANLKAIAKTIFAAATLCLSLDVGIAAAQGRSNSAPGQFDFYVLSLSWSPTFCAAQSGGRNQQQCGSDKSFRFIVHGLWPQNERGYPEFCDTKGQDRVPQALGQQLFDIMPSMGLIGHQWRKHGSCSGLSQRASFSRLREAYEKIRLPEEISRGDSQVTFSADQIEDRFIAANPGMTRRGIAASCEGNRLDEVRICFTKTMQLRDCAEVDRRGCRLDQVNIPPAR
jgi:ribonuclease T2